MMSNHSSPFVSIIVPVYNTEKFLLRCISSLLSQTEKNLELIFVDDMSTDQSGEVILTSQKEYDCIKYVKLENKRYPGGARNVGIQNAQGKYIGFVDSDDWIDTNMIRKLTSALDENNADIAICGVMTEFDSTFDQTKRYLYEIENVITGDLALSIMCREYLSDISISPIVCNKLYRADFLEKNSIQFIENNYNEDDVFNYVSFLHAKKVVIVPETFYHYYQRSDSITHTFSKKHLDDFIFAFKYIERYLHTINRYEDYNRGFHAFFEKCLHFILTILVNTEKDSSIQNEYLKYFFNNNDAVPLIASYCKFVGIGRIRKFLSPS
jgi:glycosyltransferase involved in cell wall biosynthesis